MTDEPAKPRQSLRDPLLAMANVFDRLADTEPDEDYRKQAREAAAEARRDALKEP